MFILISLTPLAVSLDYVKAKSYQGFPGSSAGKESTCNAGDPGTIPGSGRSFGEGIGYPFQCSWTSLVIQIMKNQPDMRKKGILSLGQEDALEKEMTTHFSILVWRIPWTEETDGLPCTGSQRVGHD